MTKTSFPIPLRRALIGLACGLCLVGCQSAPVPKAQKVAALKNIGFVPGNEGWELSLGVKLLFDPDVDTVSESGRAALDEVARTLAKVGIDRLRVEGHTDNVGSSKHNLALSLRRAESVAQQLVKAGWRDAAIERVGFGFDKPVADNNTGDGRTQNRRVVVTVRVD